VLNCDAFQYPNLQIQKTDDSGKKSADNQENTENKNE